MVDVRAGQRLTVGLLQSLTPQAPQTWTPNWTTSTGSATPAFGDSDVDGEYQVFGRLCIGRIDINFGSTTDFGGGTTSDNWRFSTPVTALRTNEDVGRGEAWEDSVSNGARCGIRIRLTSVDTFELEVSSGRADGTAVAANGLVDAQTPWAWAVGDNLSFHFAYPTAT
ncbi:hypothetical protein RM572_00330 [Streptomyces sp. DSM 42041]|uniref:Uncharacterized protein n=1 Tax=Streptomyces hazeniae TaxID=3075538 RepID=A0ABU2NMD8_9ACTN|nr:hypothetical protein [Streptomyces sp. DSM 42041]MDT0377222.1 hypothetical protein [Streptomyces sp. DSM 42041]